MNNSTIITRFVICCGLVFISYTLLTNTALAACLTGACHQQLKSFTKLHEPLVEGECQACHERVVAEHPLKKGRSFKLVAEGAALCLECHDVFAPASGKLHAAVDDGECLACHNPHGGSSVGLLRADGDLKVICFECHDAAPFELPHVHGPAAAGVCLECHDPHQSKYQALLLQDSKSMCLKCHVDLVAGLENSAVIHAPLEDENCSVCHEVHGGSFAHLLKGDGPKLCFSCHKEQADKYNKAKTKHTALYKEGRCGNCHAPHFANHAALLPERESDICLRCHGKDDFHRSNALKNIATELSEKKYLHGPVNDGHCSACHDPHGSDYYRLLVAAYPESFYAPYRKGTYAFCLSCHEENLLRFPETSIYTNFRDGKRNLHYTHVSDPRKGRSCRACHQSHASNGPKLVNEDGAQFGNWKIPLRLVLTETGGSCAPGCHRRISYDRKNPVIVK